MNVENQALGGTSSRSYINQKHWERVLALVKPGDYVMMQFGHNDGGGANNARGSLRGNGEETQDVTTSDGMETVHTLRLVFAQVHRRHQSQRRHADCLLADSPKHLA